MTTDSEALRSRHIHIGWWSLLAFLLLGMALDAMHAFKIGAYLDVQNESRRLMWSLAHAHGALIGLLNVVFGMPDWGESRRLLASRCLIGALILLPGGFALGGLTVHGGDPGVGILLVPVGGLLLCIAVLLAALGSSRQGP